MSYIMTQTCQSPFLGLVHSSLTILMTTLINSQELPRTDPVLFYCNKAARMALQCFTDQRPADSSVCGWCSRLALSYMCGQHGEPCSQAGISEAVPIPCTQRLNLLMILSTIDVDSSFTFYAEENLKLLHSLFLRVFLMSNTFPAPCCPDPSSWNVLLPSNSTWAYLFFNEIKYLSLDISCFLCSTVNDIWIGDCQINYFPCAHTHTPPPRFLELKL